MIVSGQSQANGFPLVGCATQPGLQHPLYGWECSTPMCGASPGSAALRILMTNELLLVRAGCWPWSHSTANTPQPCAIALAPVAPCHCGRSTRGRALAHASSRFILLCLEHTEGMLPFQFHLTFEMYIFILSFCYRELFLIIVSWRMIK